MKLTTKNLIFPALLLFTTFCHAQVGVDLKPKIWVEGFDENARTVTLTRNKNYQFNSSSASCSKMTYQWTVFGSGVQGNLNVKNPSLKFTTTGTYTIELRVEGSAGSPGEMCSGTGNIRMNGYVIVK